MKFYENVISARSGEVQSDLFVSTNYDTGSVSLDAESVDRKAGICDTVRIPVADPVQFMNRLMGALGCRIVDGEIVEAPKFKIGHRVRYKDRPDSFGTVIGVTRENLYAVEWDEGAPYFVHSDLLLPDTDDFF